MKGKVATEEQIRTVINALADVQSCSQCGTRFRFGDLDCPHCGAELDDHIRQWAEELLDKLGIG
jgi:predicted amidophosphoribosyltransferase